MLIYLVKHLIVTHLALFPLAFDCFSVSGKILFRDSYLIALKRVTP